MAVERTRELRATRCNRCGRTFFPAKQVCPGCSTDEEIAVVELNPRGTTYSVAVQMMMPHGCEPGPYVVCYADLEGSGLRVFGRLECAPEEARIGMPVELVVDDREVASDGFVYYHFRPVRRESEENQK